METFDIQSLTFRFRARGSRPSGPIRYAVGRCLYGAVLAASSAQGVCAIFLGDDADGLRGQLAGAFPGLALEEAPPSMRGRLEQVVRYIDRGAADALIELDIGGTPFQQRVWSALCAIPPGQTRTYGQLAQALGMPGAARAVGGACAANTLAIAVPCHRAVRGDGSLSGYRWGIQRKRDLLRRESSA